MSAQNTALILSPEQIEALRRIDSPTISNAIEAFDVRNRTEGYASLELRCLFPELPPMVGYAVTCTADSTIPDKSRKSSIMALYEAIQAAPKPAVVILKDVGQDRLRSCHAGDVMSSTFHRLGAVGLISDGGVRDLAGVKERAPGFQMFAPGTVVSHGTAVILEISVTVSICGLMIRPGDLLHGDASGLVSIPHSIADKVAAQSEKVWQRERELIEFVKSSAFTLEELAKRMTH